VRSSVGVLSSSSCSTIPLSARLPESFRPLLIFHLNRNNGPGRDVMAGIGEVKKRGFVDEANIAVMAGLMADL
jgi:hypothetical protein